MDKLPTSSLIGKTKVGGIDIQKPRMRAVIEAIIPLSAKPGGFNLSDLAEKVQEMQGIKKYSIHNAAYDLRKLRGKDIVRRIGKSRRYETVPRGLKVLQRYLHSEKRLLSLFWQVYVNQSVDQNQRCKVILISITGIFALK